MRHPCARQRAHRHGRGPTGQDDAAQPYPAGISRQEALGRLPKSNKPGRSDTFRNWRPRLASECPDAPHGLPAAYRRNMRVEALMARNTPLGRKSGTDEYPPLGGFHLFNPAGGADRFGLPMSFDPGAESRQQIEARYREVLRLMIEVNDTATRHLGGRHAKLVWDNLSKRGRGRPKGPASPTDDDLLLIAYADRAQGLSETDMRSLPRKLAQEVKARAPGRFRATVASIETRIRRLVKKQAENVTSMIAVIDQGVQSPPELSKKSGN